MKSEFTTKPLSALADIQTGPFGSQLHKEDYVQNGTPIVTVEHLGQKRFTEQNLPCVSEIDKERLNKYILREGDVVFSRVGSVDRCSYVSREYNGWMFSGRCLRVRPCTEIDSQYLYYYFTLESTKQFVRGIATGATMPSINTKFMGEVPIAYPPIDEQRKIATVLSALDNKIELNDKINKNLEQQIRTLCNAWLNEYAPFGGSCPNDWELTPLASFAKFISGYSYKGGELQDSTIAMATIKNFDRKGGFKLDGYKEIIPSSKLKPEHHAELFDTLVAHTDLTQNAEVIGNAEPVLSFSGYNDIIFSMDVVKVVPDNPAISKFLIAAMLQTQQFKGHCLGYVNGTTVLHLSKRALPEYSLRLPRDFKVLQPLNDAVSSMYQQMALNIDESVQLAALRDSLLPKLMSSELDVSGIDL